MKKVKLLKKEESLIRTDSMYLIVHTTLLDSVYVES